MKKNERADWDKLVTELTDEVMLLRRVENCADTMLKLKDKIGACERAMRGALFDLGELRQRREEKDQ